MSEKPLTNRKKGEFAVQLNGEWYKLRANFANMSLFEEATGTGIYELAQKASENKIKLTDVVNVVYCFLEDKTKLNRDDILEGLRAGGPIATITIVSEFIAVMLNIDDKSSSTAETSSDDKKK